MSQKHTCNPRLQLLSQAQHLFGSSRVKAIDVFVFAAVFFWE